MSCCVWGNAKSRTNQCKSINPNRTDSAERDVSTSSMCILVWLNGLCRPEQSEHRCANQFAVLCDPFQFGTISVMKAYAWNLKLLYLLKPHQAC